MLGRIRAKVQDVLGDNESGWATPCTPYAGKGVGLFLIPPKDALVWIEFEHGEPNHPIWTGCFWGDDELPDSSDASVKIWKTDSLTIRLDDNGDEMLLKNGGDSKITISDDVTTESSEASHTVGSSGVVSEQGSGKVEVTNSGVTVNDGAFQVM